ITDSAKIYFPKACNYNVSYRIKALFTDSLLPVVYSDTATGHAIDTILPDAPVIKNITVGANNIVEINVVSSSAEDVYNFTLLRRNGSGNYFGRETFLYNGSNQQLTFYDTLNSASDTFCYVL